MGLQTSEKLLGNVSCKNSMFNKNVKIEISGFEKILEKAHYFLNNWEQKIGASQIPMIKFIGDNYNKTELIGTEIGTCQAINVYCILSRLLIKKLFLVDPFMKYDDYKNIGYTDADGWDPESKFQMTMKKIHNSKDKVVLNREISEIAADFIPNDLDFVVIYGNHTFRMKVSIPYDVNVGTYTTDSGYLL